jgi:hypothetical protein
MPVYRTTRPTTSAVSRTPIVPTVPASSYIGGSMTRSPIGTPSAVRTPLAPRPSSASSYTGGTMVSSRSVPYRTPVRMAGSVFR